MMTARGIGLLALLFSIASLALPGSAARAQDASTAREVLERAAEAMGGQERLQSLDNVVLTGFGQRVYHYGGGFLTGEAKAPAKWQSVTDAQRSFDLRGARALNQERRGYQFPFAGLFGLDFTRNDTVQTGRQLLDHPLPALLQALDPQTQLGSVSIEDDIIVVEFTIHGSAAPAWLGIDRRTHLPAFSRWMESNVNLGDLTTTAWFTGYAPFDGVQLPMGLMNEIDWREQVTLMFQVDSYRVDVPQAQMPEFPPSPERVAMLAPPRATVQQVTEGVWDIRVGTSGGAVVEFADRLVMFEAYGGEQQTLARIDAANQLVPGKRVEAVIVSHHHFDHTGGIRAAVSRGLEVISHRGNEGIIREMLSRPAVQFPDALARDPHDLVFTPVDTELVLEDEMRRLEIYRVVEHAHMPNAVFAYLPEERITMEGDLGDEAWNFHWWAGALAANIAHYGIAPETNIAVHSSGPLSIAETLANNQRQAEAAQAYCAETEAGGRHVFGCPVQYDSTGVLPLPRR